MAGMGKKVMGMVVGAALGLYAFAYVGIPAITELFSADTTSWSSGAADLLPVIAIFLILGIAVVFAKPALNEL